MNLLNIRNLARFKSGINNTTTLSDADLDTLINIGYKKVQQKMLEVNQDFFEEQKTKFYLSKDQDLYSLPDDFLAMKQLRLAYKTPASEKDYKVAIAHDAAETTSILQEEESPYPIYDITGNYFRIKPAPTDDVPDGGEIYYFARRSDLSTTADVPDIPIDYHDILAVFAAKEASLKFSLTNKYNLLNNEWEKGIFDLKTALAVRETNSGQRIKNVLESNKTPTTELW